MAQGYGRTLLTHLGYARKPAALLGDHQQRPHVVPVEEGVVLRGQPEEALGPVRAQGRCVWGGSAGMQQEQCQTILAQIGHTLCFSSGTLKGEVGEGGRSARCVL